MLYCSIVDFTSLTDEWTEILRQRMKKHFTDERALKRKESVAARALLCFMLKNCFGLTDFIADCDENGKPYIEKSNLHFNLSHSGNYALCVCGDEKVGCDLEKIKACNLKVAQRFFCEKEFIALQKNEASPFAFTKMWTLKESALKFSGNGISGGLDSYDFSEYYEEDEFVMNNLHFFSFDKDGYSVSICSDGNKISQLEVSVDDIVTDS